MLARPLLPVPLLAAALLAAACTSATLEPPASPTSEDHPSAPAPAPGTRQPVEVLGAEQADDGTWTFEVPEGAVSFLLVARATDPDHELELTSFETPDGTELIDSFLAPFNFGELAVQFPRHRDDPFTPGSHHVGFAGDVEDVTALARFAPVDVAQVIDLAIWVVTDHADLADSSRGTLAATLRDAGDQILGPHRLGVGQVTYHDADAEDREEFAELSLPTTGTDDQHRALCRAMADEVDQPAMLNVAVVDRVVDPDDDEGETEGNAAGIPGATGIAGASTGCVVVVADGDRPLPTMPEVVWHEAGHLLGLFHTTEATGDAFDFFLDTPECDVDLYDRDGDEYLDAQECGRADGDNLMFHDGDGLDLSDEQAWLLRRHHLFTPAT